jgi:hypothetical protein
MDRRVQCLGLSNLRLTSMVVLPLVLVGVATVMAQETPSTPISGGGVIPILYEAGPDFPGGNVTCSQLGNYASTSGRINYVNGAFDAEFPPGLTVTTDGTYVAWASTFGIGAVIVKGGPNANVYIYDPQRTSDFGLASPPTPSGNPAGLSNITFCWNPVVPPDGPPDGAGLSDSQEPGSVLVFPKFLAGTTADGEPRSAFEIGITCPKRPDGSPGVCAEGTKVKLRAHWVCPGSQEPAEKFICKETNFDLQSTVTGTIVINPANAGHVTQQVPIPPCEAGYLLVWVINPSDQPIKYDALIGDAVLHEFDGAPAAYNAIPIQAFPGDATGTVRTAGLSFTGAPGEYQAVTGQVQGTLKYDQLDDSPYAATALTLLTLDVRSNRPNNPTFVDLNFYSEDEVLLSTSHEFICWSQVVLSDINPNLTATGLSPKGLVVSEQAVKVPIFGVFDFFGPVTLLGIVETTTWNGAYRAYSYSLYHNSRPVPTVFEP